MKHIGGLLNLFFIMGHYHMNMSQLQRVITEGVTQSRLCHRISILAKESPNGHIAYWMKQPFSDEWHIAVGPDPSKCMVC